MSDLSTILSVFNELNNQVVILFRKQWWIQVFPGGGANPLFDILFAENYEKEKNVLRRGHASLAAPPPP